MVGRSGIFIFSIFFSVLVLFDEKFCYFSTFIYHELNVFQQNLMRSVRVGKIQLNTLWSVR